MASHAKHSRRRPARKRAVDRWRLNVVTTQWLATRFLRTAGAEVRRTVRQRRRRSHRRAWRVAR